MPAMTSEETASYITHHLTLAGRSDTLFSDDAMTLVHDVARGLPRAVNNIATQALVAAWGRRRSWSWCAVASDEVRREALREWIRDAAGSLARGLQAAGR